MLTTFYDPCNSFHVFCCVASYLKRTTNVSNFIKWKMGFFLCDVQHLIQIQRISDILQY